MKIFDNEDLLELIRHAAYVEGQAQRGNFPMARFRRFSDTMDRLICHLAFEEFKVMHAARAAAAAGKPRKRSATKPSHGPATILTHPQFRGRRKRGPPPGGSDPNDAA
jgi:hypothetical protein